MQDKLRKSVADIRQNAEFLDGSANSLNLRATNLSRGSTTQSEMAASAAAAVEQMAVSISHVSDSAHIAH